MPNLTRHVGRLNNTGQRCVVVYRKLPDDSNSALIIQPDQLPDMYHDNLMDVIKGAPAQKTHELSQVLHRNKFGDGSPMLQTLHARGFLKKMEVDNITLMPYPNHPLPLSAANREIDGDIVASEQAALAALNEASATPPAQEDILPVENRVPVEIDAPVDTVPPDASDKSAIAANLISQAMLMEEDANRLREQAYELDATLRPKKGRPVMSEEEHERKRKEYNKKRRDKYAKESQSTEE